MNIGNPPLRDLLRPCRPDAGRPVRQSRDQFRQTRCAHTLPRRGGTRSGPDPRFDAVAQIANEIARRDTRVVHWRAQHLPETLSAADIRDWLLTHPDYRSSINRQRDRRFRRARLSVAIPGEDRLVIRPPQKSSLDSLGSIGRRLENQLWWHDGEGVLFTLTGITPPASPIRLSIVGDARYAAFSRIVMTIDPRVSVEDVGMAFLQVRRHPTLSGFTLGTRSRPMSARLASLAAFALTSRDIPRAQLRREWNEKHPRWRYDDSGFYRDLKRARIGVLGPKTRAADRQSPIQVALDAIVAAQAGDWP
jgi:hypothetical protein